MANCYKTALLYLVFVITIVNGDPEDGESLEADVERLKNAIENNDAEQIIDVITARTTRQRHQIIVLYKITHDDDLIGKLNSTLTGNLRNLIVGLMTPLYDYYAQELRHAVSGGVLDEGIIIEILTTIDPWQVKRIADSYERLWGNSLEGDLKKNSSDHFVGCIDVMIHPSHRYETNFRKITEGLTGDNFCSIFYRYIEAFGENPDDKDLNYMGIKHLISWSEYFAIKLHKSLNTEDERTVIRIILTRKQFDLYEIKQIFDTLYGSLGSHIKEVGVVSTIQGPFSADTSRLQQFNNDYREALFSIIVLVNARHMMNSSSEESGISSDG